MDNSCVNNGSCSFLTDDKSFSVLNDISQQSINCGESRPTYRSRKMSKAKTPSKNRLRERSGKDKSNPATPGSSMGDRFIPDVSILGNELSHFKLVQEQKAREGDDEEHGENERSRLDKDERFNILTDNSDYYKILSLANQNAIGTATKSGFACSSAKSTLTKSKRFIPTAPVKTLDAPDLLKDFYVNVLDWSATNLLTVALGSGVYMWNAATGDIVELVELEGPRDITSVKFPADNSPYIAVGVSDGSLLIYNYETKQKLRKLRGHSQRVSCIDWNESLVCSGSRSSDIFIHDSRASSALPQHLLSGHEGEVCVLKWNPERSLLASGSADCSVKIWDLVQSTGQQPGERNYLRHTLNGHSAAVKALTWLGLNNNAIATGGGSADRSIKVWNVSSGVQRTSVDTGSQVSQMCFNSHYNEIVSSHGAPANCLYVWKYPFLNKVKELYGHSDRILHLCLSPDEEVVASASEDETIRLWEVFARDPQVTKKTNANRVLGNNKPAADSAPLAQSLLMMQPR